MIFQDIKMKPSEFLSRYEPYAYAILRIVAGFLFLWHGSQKLFAFPDMGGHSQDLLMIAAGIIEFFGGLLIMTGLFARWAAFIACGEMAYAYWIIHSPHAVLPLLNHGELAMIYCFIFLYLFIRGSGPWSLDRLKKRE
jgi:putative oxidoreductase